MTRFNGLLEAVVQCEVGVGVVLELAEEGVVVAPEKEVPTQLDAPVIVHLVADARAEMARHWGRIRDYLVSLFRYQGIDEVVAEELALLPGAEELTTLLAVEELAASDAYDVVVLDCAPTDATLRLVTLPDVAHRSLRVLLPLFEAISGVAVPLARRLLSAPLPGAEVFGEADELVNRRLRALQARVRDESTSVRLVYSEIATSASARFSPASAAR